jgi:phosphohistidine phosphatase SixA
VTLLKHLIAAILLTFSGAALAQEQAQTVFVMRHLHTPAGERDPDLTDTGRDAATRLVNALGSERIAAIFVSPFKRTQQTAVPLAARLGLTPLVYDPANPADLIAKVRAVSGPVLIVGHSNTVPDLVELLGGERPQPISRDQFGQIWRVSGGRTSTSSLD